MTNSKSKKVKAYIEECKMNDLKGVNNRNRYLKYDKCGILLKLIGRTIWLKRYSYVYSKDNNDKGCDYCKIENGKYVEEDINHFIYECKLYQKEREIFFMEIKELKGEEYYNEVILKRKYIGLLHDIEEVGIIFYNYIIDCLNKKGKYRDKYVIK